LRVVELPSNPRYLFSISVWVCFCGDARHRQAGDHQEPLTCAASSTCAQETLPYSSQRLSIQWATSAAAYHGGKRRLQRRQRREATATRASTATTPPVKQYQTNLDRPQPHPKYRCSRWLSHLSVLLSHAACLSRAFRPSPAPRQDGIICPPLASIHDHRAKGKWR